ncbi:MAG: dTDP-4-dehydrorhamnose 3,5-epimerase family protein [Patescibacteria group bacterium]
MDQSQIYQPDQSLQVADNIFKTKINGLFFYQYKKHYDERGFFTEIAKVPHFNKAVVGVDFQPKQFNFSYSKTNVVRGFHAEDWNKMVTIVGGQAVCVLADIRKNSPTYTQVEYFLMGTDLESEYGAGLFISRGIANSICVLNGPVSYLYAVDMLYEDRDRTGDRAISLFDPQLNVQWPIPREKMIISQRDLDSVELNIKEAS